MIYKSEESTFVASDIRNGVRLFYLNFLSRCSNGSHDTDSKEISHINKMNTLSWLILICIGAPLLACVAVFVGGSLLILAHLVAGELGLWTVLTFMCVGAVIFTVNGFWPK